jgi:hypothetical protein
MDAEHGYAAKTVCGKEAFILMFGIKYVSAVLLYGMCLCVTLESLVLSTPTKVVLLNRTWFHARVWKTELALLSRFQNISIISMRQVA